MCLCKCSNWLHICICMNRKNNNNNNKTCTTLEWAISRSLRWIVTGNYTCMDLYFIFKIQIGFSIKSIPLIRGIPRTHAKCKVELFVASVNDWNQLTNVTKSSIFSVQLHVLLSLIQVSTFFHICPFCFYLSLVLLKSQLL